MTPSAAAVATAASTALPPSCKTFRPISVAYGSTDDTAPPLPMAIGSFGGAVGTALAGGATSTMATMAVSAEARNAERGAMTDPSPGDSWDRRSIGCVAQDATPEFVLGGYHQPWQIEHSFRCPSPTCWPGRSTTTMRLDRSPPHHRVRRPRGQPLAGTPDRLVDQEARPALRRYRSIAIRTGEHILHAWRPLAGDRAGLHHCIRDGDGCANVRRDFFAARSTWFPASIRRSGHHASCGIRSSRCCRTRAYRLKRSHGWSATAVQPSRNWCTGTSSSPCSRPARP